MTIIDAEIIKKDMNTFLTQMDSYNKYLKDFKQDLDEKGKGSNKFAFNTDKLALLSYKPTSNTNVVERKDENGDINLKQLIRFFKHRQTQLKQDTKYNKETIDALINSKLEDPGTNTTIMIKNEIIQSAKLEDIFDKKREALKVLLQENENGEEEESKYHIYQRI
jgi:hypothetical protein